MTQQTRNNLANILVVMSVLCIIGFVVQHFMTPPRPSWHKDLAWLGLAFVMVSEIVRGRSRRRANQS